MNSLQPPPLLPFISIFCPVENQTHKKCTTYVSPGEPVQNPLSGYGHMCPYFTKATLSHLVILCFFCLLGVYSENKHLIPIWGIQTFKNFTWTCTVLHLNSTVLESGSLELPASTNSCLPNETTVSGNSGIFVIVVCLYWKTMARRKKLQKR